MSKTWDTKKKILRLLSKKQMTATEISKELGVGISTVSDHIGELERIGAVNRIDNPFIKKWKYYRTDPNFSARKFIDEGMTRGGIGSRMPQIAAGIVIAMMVLGFLAFGLGGLSANTGVLPGSMLTVRMTDPPHVPNGTTALNISYSSLQVHEIGIDNSSGWATSNSGGSLDLLSIINSSEVIGEAPVPANAVVDAVRFNITSAQMTVNGSTYNVIVPGGEITARLSERSRVNGSSSVLIDFSPTVAGIYTDNSTIFVMVPSVKAVIVGGGGEKVGSRSELNSSTEGILGSVRGGMSISEASLQENGNITNISVTVMNDGRKPVDVKHIMVYGSEGVFVSEGTAGTNSILNENMRPLPGAGLGKNAGNGSVFLNLTVAGEADGAGYLHSGQRNGTPFSAGNEVGIFGNGLGTEMKMHGMLMVEVHSGGVANGSGGSIDRKLLGQGEMADRMRSLLFAVGSNGSLELPSDISGINSGGYLIAPNGSATFRYSGEISYAGGKIAVSFVPGTEYTVSVQGEEDAGASALVNATG